MKKLLVILALSVPLLLGFTVHKGDRGKIGTIYQCTVDADVDTAFSTTVDANSNSGQAVLNIAATTNLAANDVLIVDPGGTREEICTVLSVSAGVSVTCTANLQFTHTLAQADTVRLTNRIGPLNSGAIYLVQLVTSADAVQPGAFLQGDTDVDISDGTNQAVSISANAPVYQVKVQGNRLYMGFISQANNAIARVCQIN